ncbi:response regulator [Nevskia sp.]|uniref:response regulator n=1 Tax=Nevskia sp. TaxID=1929292 RepID=UPI0025E81085|nr:response regulator [Nevskia sp.]
MTDDAPATPDAAKDAPADADLSRLRPADELSAADEHQRNMADLAESLPGAVFQIAMDRQGRIRYRYVSARVREVLGVESQAVLDDPMLPPKLVLGSDSALLFKAYWTSSQSLKPFSVDVRIQRPDGVQRWMRTSATPRRTADGFVWNGWWNDVSEEVERRERLIDSERALRDVAERAEKRLRAITDTVPGIVFQLRRNDDGSIGVNYVSKATEELLGISREAVFEDFGLFLAVVADEDRPRLLAGLKASAEDMTRRENISRIRHADGSTRWIRNIITPRIEDDGALVWDGITVDVTALKEGEAAEQRLREITDSLPGVVYQYRMAPQEVGTYTMISDQGEKLFGATRHEVLSNPMALISLVTGADRAKLVGGFILGAKENRDIEVTYRSKVAGGREAWLRTFAKPVPQPDGSVAWSGFTLDVTAEVTTRQKLEAIEQRLSEIVKAVPGMVYRFRALGDNRFETSFVSDGIRELTGIEPAGDMAAAGNPISRQLSEIVVEEDRERLQAATLASIASEGPLRCDFRIVHAKTGDVRWMRTIGTPRRQKDGSTAFTGVWQDISDAKALELELRATRDKALAAEKLVREVTDNIPGAVFQRRLLADGTVTYPFVSKGLSEMFAEEYPEDGTPLQRHQEQAFFSPEDVERIYETRRVSAETLTPYTIEVRQPLRGGRMAWTRTSAVPHRDADGAIVWNGFLVEITDRKEAEARLEAAERRLRAIFDHTRIGLVMIDADLNFSDANPSLRELLEIEDEEEFARDFPSFSPPLQPDGSPSMDKAALMIRSAFDDGYRRFFWMHQTRSGELRPCEVALTRVELGATPFIFATMTDQRERLRTEAALTDATEAAQAASRAKSEFLANMSHEIRTPMNAIMGLSHLGSRARDLRQAQEYLGKIHGSAQSLLQVLNDVLDVSKIEAGKLSLETTPFQLHAVLDNLSSVLSVQAAQKGLELLFDIDATAPDALIGDPLRLGQVLMNLTGNAIKFTGAGEVVVKVGVIAREADHVRLGFAVSDTGIGMTTDEIGRLFQAFSQADSSTTRRYGGTGLGLTICKRLVEMMDGEISIDSQPGRGSCFRFSVRVGVSARSTPRIVPEALRELRVLVVDDNPTASEILRSHLDAFGFRIALAADGPEAVARVQGARHDPFGLVLMDWQMPQMNGIEAARRIRALGPPQPPLIIMVTAFGREEIEREARDAGLDGFLVKPVNPSLLFDSILDAFGSARVSDGREPLPPFDGSAEPAGLRGLKVLVAEDNEINQQVACELLEAAGVEVCIAPNGLVAVEEARAHHFDAVLMDLQMPLMDGLEATRALRAEGGELARIPIIAMTANAMAEDRARCLEAGMNDHLGKPIDVRRLYALLERWTRPAAGSARAASLRTPRTVAGKGEGCDFAAAVDRLGGSRALWQKLGRRFLDTPRDAAEIERHLAAGNRDAARRGAHTLKGVAAALGAQALSEAASAVEQAVLAAAADAGFKLAEMDRQDIAARAAIRAQLDDWQA